MAKSISKRVREHHNKTPKSTENKSGQLQHRIKQFLTFGFAGGLSALSLGIAIQYGMSIGSATGLTTSVLLVALGILTEAGKALGFYSSASATRNGSWLPAAGWSVVALCCLAYSVAADLHVSATSRGDATAQRSATTQTVKDARFDRETAAIALRSSRAKHHSTSASESYWTDRVRMAV